jgi:serine/threonine-protein kinase
MATSQDRDPATPGGGAFDDEAEVELEPTMVLERAEGWTLPWADAGSAGGGDSGVGAKSAAPGVALVQGSLASLAGETHDLRRDRLKAAAIFLAVVYGVLVFWVFISDNPGTLTASGGYFSVRVVLLALRCLLAAGVAGLLASEAPLSPRALRGAEYALFLGMTLLVMASQFFVNLDLMHRGNNAFYTPIILAFIKDGIIQMIVLMMIYGTLIPNPPAHSARVIAAMFLGPVLTAVLVRAHPAAAPIVAMLRVAEDAGSNALFLAFGAAMAIYSSYLLNNLRCDLHAAKKYGQYQLVRKIGAGGMGEVHLAEHSLLKRPCALKLIKPGSGADPVALARFEREVRSAAKLSHPNSIEIFDYGHTDDGTFYYVMEYLRGMSLADLVRRAGPLPPGRTVYLFRQACAGLAEAHALGLIHRDLKPANLFIAVRGGESDVAKVLDFGLVKLTSEAAPDSPQLTADNVVSGTPLFMSPEQATATKALDARADIYALGAMMYYSLTARPPFEGDSAFTVMMAHVRDEVVPPSKHCPGLPEDLERIVLRCLAKKPEERFPDVRTLGRALAACHSVPDWDPERAEAWWNETLRADPSLAAV